MENGNKQQWAPGKNEELKNRDRELDSETWRNRRKKPNSDGLQDRQGANKKTAPGSRTQRDGERGKKKK